MNKYYSIHSDQPELLVKMLSDLEAKGFYNDKHWNKYSNPIRESNYRWLIIYTDNRMGFFNQGGFNNPTRHELTEQNYTDLINEIIATNAVLQHSKNNFMSDTLTIKKDRVLAAAAKCSTAKETLKEIFPEAFEDDKWLDLTKETVGGLKHFIKDGGSLSSMISVRSGSDYEGKSYFLNHLYDWEIRRDNNGQLCLIPTRK